MLEKEVFKRYVKSYLKFSSYLDKLADLNIGIWEEPDVGIFEDNYVKILSLLMDLDIDTTNGNILENFLYDYYNPEASDEEIYTLHDAIVQGVTELHKEESEDCFEDYQKKLDEIFESLVDKFTDSEEQVIMIL